MGARLVLVPFLLLASLGTGPQSAGAPGPLQPCEAGQGRGATPAECGTVTVFENRPSQHGRTLGIHFLVLRSTSGPSREALFMLAGGPGQGAIATFAVTPWVGPVRATMDLVLVDQRGSGRSHALNCDVTATTDPAGTFGAMYPADWARRCRDLLSVDADLTQYTTDAAVQDLEDVRAALGYDKIALYGGSYGTRMAQAYMRRYPSHVKAAVIDGVVPFDNKLPVTYAASAQLALDRIVAACAATPACAQAHPALRGDFTGLLHRFDGGPVPTTVSLSGGTLVPVMMSRGDFAYAVRGLLYDPAANRTLPDVIGRAVTSGDLHEFAQSYWQRQVAFSRDFAYGLHFSVFCSEDLPFISEADITEATAHTFLGRYVIDEYRRACALWPRGRIASDYRTPVTVSVPTLLVSGYFDPATPPEFAERIAKSLPLAHLVVAPTGSHGSAAGCPRAAVLQVLIGGKLDDLPDACHSESRKPSSPIVAARSTDRER
jgi:pimeloyl-ACP methyl ester carboxylesterase